MKKMYFIFLTLLLLVSIGCANKQQVNESSDEDVKTHREYNVFQGSSENWEAQLIADYTETFTKVDGQWKYDYTPKKSKCYFKYKGKNPESLGMIVYEVKDNPDGGWSDVSDSPSAEIEAGSQVYRKDDVFTVTVKWQDKEETFEIKAVSDSAQN